MRKLFVTILLGLFISTAFAQESPSQFGMDESQYIPVGLNSGEIAPKFTAKDVNGDDINLNEMLKKGKVVLLFYRGQWCPVCNKYLSKFQEEVGQILEKGASVVAITPETTDNAKEMVGKTGMTFSVVPDTEGKIMKDYDVLFHVADNYEKEISTFLKTDIAENNGADEAFLPVPATYIINQNGKIDKVFFNYNYKKRASVAEILTFL